MVEMDNIDNLVDWLLDDDRWGIWEHEVNGMEVQKIKIANADSRFVGVCGGVIDFPKEKTRESYLKLAQFIVHLTLCSDDGDDEDDDE